jgi:hypothetical protein
MGHTKESVEALIEGEASESEEFACPYCGESYETSYEQGRCQASHFENTDSIPVRTQKRNQGKNIVEEWRRGEKVEEG